MKITSHALFFLCILGACASCDQYEFDLTAFGESSNQPSDPASSPEEKAPANQLPSPQTPQNPDFWRQAGKALQNRISAVQDAGRPSAQDKRQITRDTFPQLYKYFPEALLAQVTIIVTKDLPLPCLADFGISAANLGHLDSRIAAMNADTEAITYDTTIYIRPDRIGAEHDHVLLHELVHVIQYKELGVLTFGSWYGYFEITFGSQNPMERMAYNWEEAYQNGSLPAGDLSLQVRRELNAIAPTLSH